ncbi:MAG: TRAP transporter permease, partial [Acidobacteriota bacterium]
MLLRLVFLAAVALSGFQLWQGVTGGMPATYLRPVHIAWVLALIFLRYPLVKEARSSPYRWGRAADILLACASLYCGYVVTTFDYKSIEHILYGLRPSDLVAGTLFVCLVLEATRRSVGWSMAAVGLIFILYAAFGNLLPETLANRGFSLERIIRFQVFTAAGLFGTPLGIAAGTVFIFILFGAFLEVTGAGRFFIDLAFAAAGKYPGGPAKASVIASAAMGSISGSAIANTVTTGALTIPMMKKLGYKATQAAGIEAAASTGGQIMPPIMGAGAFIMAEFTDRPYNNIVLISVAPAVLYFLSTLLYVHIMACKQGLRGMEKRPPVWTTVKDGIHFILPLFVVTTLLLLNYSPPLVGAVGCLAVVLTSLFRPHTRVSATGLLKGLKAGAVMALPISVACATAGVVVGVIGQTGIGLQFTDFVLSL